ncbi:hypothetical protein C882_2150 [Caenispirillum salinarum AK4]|uniref:Uncharacterized protein n=1 Tax=Caenispirillum salinarum AK4 TaxID=1238182 RepID=K9HDV4_9PROT|nr:hypothetical protein C882_2150 [Caenispirillum salinarum AK4]
MTGRIPTRSDGFLCAGDPGPGRRLPASRALWLPPPASSERFNRAHLREIPPPCHGSNATILRSLTESGKGCRNRPLHGPAVQKPSSRRNRAPWVAHCRPCPSGERNLSGQRFNGMERWGQRFT